MSNFEFLAKRSEYRMFAAAAIEAERVYTSAPAMSAVGSRKALELAVKWVYAADKNNKKNHIGIISNHLYMSQHSVLRSTTGHGASSLTS